MSNQKPQSPFPVDVAMSSSATEHSSLKAKKRRRDSSPERAALASVDADIDLATEHSSPKPKKPYRDSSLNRTSAASAAFFPGPAIAQISFSQSASTTSPAAVTETSDFATLRQLAFAENWEAVLEVIEKSRVLTPEIINQEVERDVRRWINFPQFLVDCQQWGVLRLLLLQGLVTQPTVAKQVTTGATQGANLLWHLAFHQQWHLIEILISGNSMSADDFASRSVAEGPDQGKNVLWLLAFHGQWDLIDQIVERKLVTTTAVTSCALSGLYEGTNVLWFLAFWQRWQTIEKLNKLRAIVGSTLSSSPQRGAEHGKNVLWLLAYHYQGQIIHNLMANGHISAAILAAEAQSGAEQGQSALLRLVSAEQFAVVLNLANIITGPMLLSQPKYRPGEHVALCIVAAGENDLLMAIWPAVLTTLRLLEVQEQQQADSMLMRMFNSLSGNPFFADFFGDLHLLLTAPMVEKTIRGENLLYRLFRAEYYVVIQHLVDNNLITTAALKGQIDIDLLTITGPVAQGRSAWGLLLGQLFSEPITHQCWGFLELLILQRRIDSHLLLMIAINDRREIDILINQQLTLPNILMSKMEENGTQRIRDMLRGLLPHVTTQMLLANNAGHLCFLERLLRREADALHFLPLLSTARLNPLAAIDWEDFAELAGQCMLNLWLHEHAAASSSDNYPSFKRLLDLGLPLPTAVEIARALPESTRREWEASIRAIAASLGKNIPPVREEVQDLFMVPAKSAVTRYFRPEAFWERQIKKTVVKFAIIAAEMDAYANFPKDIFSLIFAYSLILDEGATSDTSNRHNPLIVAAMLEGREWYAQQRLSPVRDYGYDSVLHAVFGAQLGVAKTYFCADVLNVRKEIAEKIRTAFDAPKLCPALISSIKSMMIAKDYGGNVLITTLKRAYQQWESVQEQRLFLLEELLKKNVEAIKYLEENWDLPAHTLAVNPRLHACLARVQKSASLDDFLAIEKILSRDPELFSAYKAYFTAPPFQLEEYLTPSLIEKYAASIEQFDHYLMLCDLPLIAALFDIHLICHIPEEGVVSYNAEAHKIVELSFDGNKIFTCLEQRTAASFTASPAVPITLLPALPEKNGKDEKVTASKAWIPSSGDGVNHFERRSRPRAMDDLGIPLPIAEVKKSGHGKRFREEEPEHDGSVIKVAKQQEATEPLSGAVELAAVRGDSSVEQELFKLINRNSWSEAQQLVKRVVIDYKLLFDLAKQAKNSAASLYNVLQFSTKILPARQLQELIADQMINTELLLTKYQGGNLLCYLAAQGHWKFIVLLLPQITLPLLLDEAAKDSVSIPPAKNFAQFLLGNAGSIDLEDFKKIMGHVFCLSFDIQVIDIQAASRVGAALNAKDTVRLLRYFTLKGAMRLIEEFRLPLPELAELHEFLFESTAADRPSYMQLALMYEQRAALIEQEQISQVFSLRPTLSPSYLADIWQTRSQAAPAAASSAAQSQVASVSSSLSLVGD